MDGEINWVEQFYKNVHRDLIESRQGIHVSHLVYDCVRRAYYDLTSDKASFSLDGALKMWIGKKIHELPISDNHELTLHWEGITGTIDEYQDGWFLDKKTTREIPRYPYDNHKKQLEMYRVLLEKNSYPVTNASMLYIDVNTTEVKEFPIKLEKNIENIELEMLSKKRTVEAALKAKSPPKRGIGWICRYCDHTVKCFSEES